MIVYLNYVKYIPAKICWLNLSGKFSVHMKIPPIGIKIMLESKPSEVQNLSTEIGRIKTRELANHCGFVLQRWNQQPMRDERARNILADSYFSVDGQTEYGCMTRTRPSLVRNTHLWAHPHLASATATVHASLRASRRKQTTTLTASRRNGDGLVASLLPPPPPPAPHYLLCCITLEYVILHSIMFYYITQYHIIVYWFIICGGAALHGADEVPHSLPLRGQSARTTNNTWTYNTQIDKQVSKSINT